MEYSSSMKSNKTMKFTGKWIKLENTLLSDVIHTQKEKKKKLKHVLSHLFFFLVPSLKI